MTTIAPSAPTPIPVRLHPVDDLRKAREEAVAARGCEAAFVVSGIGSLSATRLRLANEKESRELSGPVEILTLSGTAAMNGSHLHMSVADATGAVTGGHVAHGYIVRTTAEVLLVPLADWSFRREPDAATRGHTERCLRGFDFRQQIRVAVEHLEQFHEGQGRFGLPVLIS